MSHDQPESPVEDLLSPSRFTLPEIMQQPALWPVTIDIVRAVSQQIDLARKFKDARVLLTGAGTSAYAACAVAAAWPRAFAVPSTDLLVDPERFLTDADVVISLARCGNSPESAAVVERIRALR